MRHHLSTCTSPTTRRFCAALLFTGLAGVILLGMLWSTVTGTLGVPQVNATAQELDSGHLGQATINGQAITSGSWPGWSALGSVMVHLGATSADSYLITAAEELQTYLGQISGRTWNLVQLNPGDPDPGGPAIRLKIDSSDPSLSGRNDEAVRLLTDDQGIHITGRTPIAVRHGAYFLGALARKRLPIATTPMFSVAYGLTLAAMAWTALDPSGAMARWTLPLVGVIYGTSAVLIHRRSHPGLHGLVEWVLGRLYQGQPADLSRQIGAAGFGLAAAVLVPLWVALVLLWLGVEGAIHAYNPLVWAFVSALLAHLVLRRYAALYATVFLTFGVVLGASAVMVGLLFQSQVVLLSVLYGAAALSALYRFFLRSEVPLYLASVLLLVPFGLTLDLMGVSPLLWSTPLMALAVAYLGLGLLLGNRLQTTAARPLYDVGFSA